MSTYDDYRKRVSEMADKLPSPKKDIDQTLLWLKASVTERLQRDIETLDVDGELYVGEAGKDSFGFKEKTVNQLLHYAFEAGKKESDEKNKSVIKDMKVSIEEVISAVSEYIDMPYS